MLSISLGARPRIIWWPTVYLSLRRVYSIIAASHCIQLHFKIITGNYRPSSRQNTATLGSMHCICLNCHLTHTFHHKYDLFKKDTFDTLLYHLWSHVHRYWYKVYITGSKQTFSVCNHIWVGMLFKGLRPVWRDLLSKCMRVRGNRKSQSRALRAMDWTNCSHEFLKSECGAQSECRFACYTHRYITWCP